MCEGAGLIGHTARKTCNQCLFLDRSEIASVLLPVFQAGVCSAGQSAVDMKQTGTFISLPAVLSGDDKTRNDDNGDDTSVITRTRTRAKKPSLYRVLLMNDDYTPMEFVVHVLQRFFNKNDAEAHRIMLHVHHQGVGECGVFTYEVAETKVTQVMDFARKHQHPLQCVMEKN